jgi:predicted dehydrogenase
MPLKVGIVGSHGIVVPHVKAYSQDPLAELVAICDLVRERADSAAERYGVKAYYSLSEMLANEPDLDIVDVCTGGFENGSWHYEPAMQAMEAGKHVLVEKPLSSEIREAREMVVTAARKNVYLGCNLNHYFTLPAEKARQYQDEGGVGELVYCLTKMGFQGGEPENYQAPASSKVKGFPYFHL